MTEIENTQTSISNQKLHWIYKVLTFFLPEAIAAIVPFLCTVILGMPLLGLFLSLPTSILLQVIIFKKLNKNGYNRMAADFKSWSLNSWIFLTILFILEMLLKYL
jgi:hypothetical protein